MNLSNAQCHLARRILALPVFDVDELRSGYQQAYKSLPSNLRDTGALTFWFDTDSDLHAEDENENSYNYDDLTGRWDCVQDVTEETRKYPPEVPMPRRKQIVALLLVAAKLLMSQPQMTEHHER